MTPAILIGEGANRMAFPVTAFESIERGVEVIREMDLPVEIGEIGTGEGGYRACSITVAREPGAAGEVASEMWDGHYFMGDPPLSYSLRETDNELGLFYISDD